VKQVLSNLIFEQQFPTRAPSPGRSDCVCAEDAFALFIHGETLL